MDDMYEQPNIQIPSFLGNKQEQHGGNFKLRTPFDRKIDENFGYVSSVQGAYKLIGEFKTRSTTKFSCFKVDKDFGNIGLYLRFMC